MRTICTYDEAYAIALSLAAPRRQTHQDVWTDGGMPSILADSVRSLVDLPPFHRAMMDGFAVHKDDLESTEELLIIDDIHAGEQPATSVSPGTVVEIRTGAPVPPDTSAVVRKEWVEWTSETSIRLLRQVAPGESIQVQGEDTVAGNVLLERGAVVDGQTRTVLRAAGIRQIPVFAPVRTAIVSTGSELVTNTVSTLGAGQVYAASDAFLQSSLRQLGVVVADVTYVDDDPARIEHAISRYIDKVDYILVTGGASVGDTDYATSVIRKISGTSSLPIERVWMRPGSPFLGARAGSTTIFGMSGNPAACFVQFHVLALPAIRTSLGMDTSLFADLAVLAQPIRLKPVKHVRFHRATASLSGSEFCVLPQAGQSSGLVTGLASVNAIIRLDKQVYERGEQVRVLITNTANGRLL